MPSATHPRDWTPQYWKNYLVNRIVYVKPQVERGSKGHALYAADGKFLDFVEGDINEAFQAVWSKNLDANLVH